MYNMNLWTTLNYSEWKWESKVFFSGHILANSLTLNPYQQKVKLSDEKHIRVGHVDMSSETRL